MYKSTLYKGDELLGEVEIYPQQQLDEEEHREEDKEVENQNLMKKKKMKKVIDEILMSKEIRISNFSPPSERCPPLAVLHTITCGMCFKMESKTIETQLHLLHSSCIQENKTAVVSLGGEEIHLVAMCSRNNETLPCFWGFNVSTGLYDSCLVMLNLRCLGIVFDLDETLIVANTMRSFEDRIEALQRKINTEVDPQRIAGMLSEVKRYQDDKIILKQYVENDQVIENGRVIKTQFEVVPALSDNHQPIMRPLIRLQERNIILTRINPQIRDTSVLVRLRPAWEDLRSYLTARGRKRFEVYVCTMAERDYALEMWRLLDPESNLINSKELLDRIVCVKSGKKSLFNVFQDGTCHPKMALVIDDRSKVWVEKDQPRVHVVPAFAPYYAPQAEANNAVPVLCVARNVACNVRGGFFKEFDEGLLQSIPEVSYEDDFDDIPSPPDVSSYLVSEDDASTSNGQNPLPFDGMADAEVEKQLKDAISTAMFPSTVNTFDPRIIPALQYTLASSSSSIPASTSQSSVMPFSSIQFPQGASLVKPLAQVGPPEPNLQSSPAREEGEVPESELDPDTRRRLLILQHGQDTRENPPSEPQFPVRPSMQVSVPLAQSLGSWGAPVEEEMSPRQLNPTVPREFPMEMEPLHIEKHRPHHPPFFPKVENSILSDRMANENQRLPKAAPYRDDRLRSNHTMANYHSISGEENPLNRSSTSSRDLDFEPERAAPSAETPVEVLQEIAMKCGAKVEFRPSLVDSRDLQFSTEAWFAGEKVGEGVGKTRREAQRLAAEGSIKNLADIYMQRAKTDNGAMHGDPSRYSSGNDNSYLGNMNSLGIQSLPKDESAPEPLRLPDPRLDNSKKLVGSVTALKEFCTVEGLGLNFLSSTPLSSTSLQNDEVHAQVEIDGQIMGRGIGSSWDEAKMQAAEKALGSLKTMFGQFTTKRQGSPRSMQGMPNKRLKPGFTRGLQRMPSSNRYPKNTPPVP